MNQAHALFVGEWMLLVYGQRSSYNMEGERLDMYSKYKASYWQLMNLESKCIIPYEITLQRNSKNGYTVFLINVFIQLLCMCSGT